METFHNLDRLIAIALEEDLGEAGDITSEAIFADEQHIFRLISKDSGVLCGAEVFARVMQITDPLIEVEFNFDDGGLIKNGDLVALVRGSVRSILKAERTALNFLSLMTAVATRTSRFAGEARGKTTVLDTRKTIPGFRHLQKYAVRVGGGTNHRMGLHDMVLIKDNHIDAAGGISAAVEKIRLKWGERYKIEVEARTLQEVREALTCRVDRIMLDNMDTGQMERAVEMISGSCETEASGNMTLDRVSETSSTGVDFISAGELTHTISAFDFSLKQ